LTIIKNFHVDREFNARLEAFVAREGWPASAAMRHLIDLGLRAEGFPPSAHLPTESDQRD
jgi:hypothetical protein